jgi:hypothetical protein
MRFSRAHFSVLVFALLALASPFDGKAAENPYRVLLDDPFPTSAPPVKLVPAMYRWRGIETLPPGSKLDWEAESAQWSRIDDRIVLPRARVKIEIPGAESAIVSTWERTTPLRKSLKGSWFGEVTVPLVSGDASKLSIFAKIAGRETEFPLTLERVGGDREDSFGIDASCSPWQVSLSRRVAIADSAKPLAHPALVLADCRVIREASSDGFLASLDLFLFLDGAGDSIKMNGSTMKAEAPSLFRIRLFPQNQPILLESANGGTFELRYRIPTKLNRGFLGVGLGPYKYHLEAPGSGANATAAVLTIYGSYQLSESVRFTAFNATVVNPNFYSDTGFYLKSDSAKFLDGRVTFSVMLGANLMGFHYDSSTHKKWGAPQGFEAVYHDFLSPNRSLVVGAFIYPLIEGKSYYNSWLRYGSPALFGEVNYLGVRNQFLDETVTVRSIGFSLGFPLARFF